MTKWNTVVAESDCGYKHTQHVLDSKVVSAKVWSRYAGEVDVNFDTDDSPSISVRLYASGKSKAKVVNFGKQIVEMILLPKYVKVQAPKKVTRKVSTKKVARKVSTKKAQKTSGNTKQALSLRASRQTRDSHGRFA